LAVAAGAGSFVGALAVMLAFAFLYACGAGVRSCISKIKSPFRSDGNGHSALSGIFNCRSHADSDHAAPSRSVTLEL